MAIPEENNKPATKRNRNKKLQVGPRNSGSEKASMAEETLTETPEKSTWSFGGKKKEKKKKKEKFTRTLSPERTKELLAQLAAEKQANEENNPKGVEGKVDPKQDVDTDFQRTFAGNLFTVQGEQSTLSTQKKYDQEVADWAGSAASRTRLIIIEATASTSIKNLARATFNAKPLERVLITGLTREKEVALQEQLKDLWKERALENRNREYEKKLKTLGEKRHLDHKTKEFGKKLQPLIEESKQEFEDSQFGNDLQKLWANKAENTYDDIPDINPFVTDQASVDTFMAEKEAEIDKMSLSTLLGPHLSQKENNIRHDLLTRLHPQCDVNIEDVLYYGENNQLLRDLGDLGRKIKNGIPTFSVKSKPFDEGENRDLWHCASKNSDEFLAAITQGKTPTALLGKQTDGSYAHVTLSDTYQKLLDLDRLKSEMNLYGIAPDIIKDAEQKDLDYIGSALFDNCIYRQGVTPKTLETTRAKASSIQAAEKAGELKGALNGNIVDKPTSSAVEVDYAIGQMALDGGGDITSEDLKKRNAYRLFYEAILDTLTEKGVTPKEAIPLAITQTLQAYVANEKKNKRIHELENGDTGAKAWRALAVKYTNKVKKSNNRGIKALIPSMPLFVSGTTGGWAWLVAGFATKIATKVNWVLGGIGMAISAASVAFKGISMVNQIKANRTELNIANDASAQANVKMLDAHNERKTKLAEQLAGIQGKLEEQNSFDGIKEHVTNNSAKIIQKKKTVPSKPSFKDKIVLKKKKNAKYPMLTTENETVMLDTLKTLRKQMPDIDVEVHADIITAEVQLDYTKELYGKQAEVSRQMAEKEYAENRVSWMESGSNRARLLVLEANDQNLDQLATSVLEASPIERIMIAGLTPARQPEFETKLKELWKEKLDTLEKKSNFEDKLNQPLMASTREKLAQLCASALEDENNPDIASNFETKFKELWEKPIISSANDLKDFVETYGTVVEMKDAMYAQLELAQSQKQSFEFWLENSSLEDLMGPHLFKDNLNLAPEEMATQFPQFDTNIEEVLCVGTSNELVENLDELGRSIQSGVPVFPVKSEKLTPADEGLWKCACKDPEEFFEEMIQGRSAAQLIGPKTADGGYANIELSAAFQELFQLDKMQKEMQEQQIPVADNLTQEDLNYVKKILFEEALCPGYITPDGTEKINAKSITQLSSIAGELVGDALKYNLVGNPKSTVVEVMLAIAAMTLDAGGDMYRHQAAKKTAYTLLFEKLKNTYSNATDPAMTPKEATKKALVDTLATITTIEKQTEKMTKQLQATQEWRDLALDKTNETKAHNDAAIKALKGSGERFIFGTAISIALLATTPVTAIPFAAIATAAGTAAAVGVFQIGAVTKSTWEMIAANGTSLPQANRAANKIDGGESEAHKLRESCIAEVVDTLTGNNNAQKPTIAQALTTMQEKNRVQDEKDTSKEKEQQEQVPPLPEHPRFGSRVEKQENIWGASLSGLSNEDNYEEKNEEEEEEEFSNDVILQDDTSSTRSTGNQSSTIDKVTIPNKQPPYSPIAINNHNTTETNEILPPPSPSTASSRNSQQEKKTSIGSRTPDPIRKTGPRKLTLHKRKVTKANVSASQVQRLGERPVTSITSSRRKPKAKAGTPTSTPKQRRVRVSP